MNIKNEKGQVTFRMKVGKDMVRNTMSISTARGIIARGKTSEEVNGELIIDGLYFFPVEPKKKKTETEITESELSENE